MDHEKFKEKWMPSLVHPGVFYFEWSTNYIELTKSKTFIFYNGKMVECSSYDEALKLFPYQKN